MYISTALLSEHELLTDWQRWVNFKYLLTILFLGILSTLGTSLLTSIGIKSLSAMQTSIFSNISPLFGILAGVVILDDVLQSYQIIGAIFIFTGMFISLKLTKKNNNLMKQQNINNLTTMWLLASKPFGQYEKSGDINIIELEFQNGQIAFGKTWKTSKSHPKLLRIF